MSLQTDVVSTFVVITGKIPKKKHANQNSESELVILEIPLLHAAWASSDLQDQVLNDHHVFPKFQRWGINSKYQGSQITAPVVIAYNESMIRICFSKRVKRTRVSKHANGPPKGTRRTRIVFNRLS